jgi:DNA-binding protein H-NS
MRSDMWFSRRQSNRQLLLEVLSRLDKIEDRLDDLDINNEDEEFTELKTQVKEHGKFLQNIVMSVIDTQAARVNKPSAAELYAASKATTQPTQLNGAANSNNTKSPKELNRETRRLPLP